MKKSVLFLIVMLICATSSYSQKPSIELTFTADYHGNYAPITSIIVKNLSKGGDTTLTSPITTLVLYYTLGIKDLYGNEKNALALTQNYPNPFREQTTFRVFLPGKDRLKIGVYNLMGQEVIHKEMTLERGYHSFTFYPGNDRHYLVKASVNGMTGSIKMVSLRSHSGSQCSLMYTGTDQAFPVTKAVNDINEFTYSLGDTLRLVCYALTPGFMTVSGAIEDAPLANKAYEFKVSEGTLCPGMETVNYEGQVYSTVKIGDQCWMKDNLNVGTRIDGQYGAGNNGLIEKYCYSDDPANCDIYGGMYQWDEMMKYNAQPGTQGICPPGGWHLPTDAEWTAMTDYLGGVQVAGGKLKEIGISHWNDPNTGATNESGFTALGSGIRTEWGNFTDMGNRTSFWTSTPTGMDATGRTLSFTDAGVTSLGYSKDAGFSVRCVRIIPPVWACGDTIIDARDNKIYNTVEIGTQCWMQNNLNVGTKIPGANAQSNNSLIEKYCYNDDENNCNVYGGLYLWDEMMQYGVQPGVKGICPSGWHLPSDPEYTVLCEFLGGEGVAGAQMKTTTGWNFGGNGSNSSGFTAQPAGYRSNNGNFYGMSEQVYLYSSSQYSTGDAFHRFLIYNSPFLFRDYNTKNYGGVVRCLKN
jgi:uncharacterized protein (TIGR02145 family)